jgi:hypothetical protein
MWLSTDLVYLLYVLKTILYTQYSVHSRNIGVEDANIYDPYTRRYKTGYFRLYKISFVLFHAHLNCTNSFYYKIQNTRYSPDFLVLNVSTILYDEASKHLHILRDHYDTADSPSMYKYVNADTLKVS